MTTRMRACVALSLVCVVVGGATLSAEITATSGSITGGMAIGTAGNIHSGASAYGTGTGWWMDYNTGTPRLRVGDPAGNRLQWDGTNLTLISSEVTIDADGIKINKGTGTANQLKWVDGALSAGMYYFNSGTPSLEIFSPSGGVMDLTVGSNSLSLSGVSLLSNGITTIGNSFVPFAAIYATTYYGGAAVAGVTDNFVCGANKVESIYVAGGIVTAVDCGTDTTSARIASLERRIAELEAMLARR
ncbi:MAG: hypothetical protein NTV05_05175 [Acidobacteria bacterium]|nr:hypothetical protein [Acidobacteriota bacterium]